MGFLERLAGWKEILHYEIVFEGRAMGVGISPLVPEVPNPEYIRLWATYEALVIYSLGFPENLSARMALELLLRVASGGVGADTDCFKRASLLDVVQFSPHVPVGGTRLTGEYYAKGIQRTIKGRFRNKVSEQQIVYSGLALLQYAVSMNSGDPESLNVLTNTVRYLVALCRSSMFQGVASVQIGTQAYLRAIQDLPPRTSNDQSP